MFSFSLGETTQRFNLFFYCTSQDARAALQLYRLYLSFQEEGRFDDVMDDIFAEGKRLVCDLVLSLSFSLSCWLTSSV